MTTSSVVSVFPCLPYNAAVRSFTLHLFFDAEADLLQALFCDVLVEWTQRKSWKTRVLLFLVWVRQPVTRCPDSACPTTLAIHSAGMSPKMNNSITECLV